MDKMDSVILSITIRDTQNGRVSTYERRYSSMEDFLADHAAYYDQSYGSGGWSVAEV